LYTIIHTAKGCNENITTVVWVPTSPTVAGAEGN